MKRLLFLATLLGLAVPTASAWTIYNQTGTTMNAQVTEGDFNEDVPANGSKSCNWSNESCNPSGNRTAVVTLVVQTRDSSSLDWKARVKMEAGGYAEIKSDQNGFRVRTVNHSDGRQRETSLRGAGGVDRSIRFLASADCQFANHGQADQAGNDTAECVHTVMTDMLDANSDIRGIIMAGDLTQNAWASDGTPDWDEWDTYIDSLNGRTRFVFDGLGNHDVKESSDASKSNPDIIIRELRARKRVTKKAKKELTRGPHYSWDWHDVHFVQLNLFPGDDPASVRPDFDPDGALTFLIDDLASQVGSSDRPVVLIHHYGFDGFSTDGEGDDNVGWWGESEREAYWNAITGYNVVLILTGHFHQGADSDFREDFVRPAGSTGGPASIPAFICAASKSGAFVDVLMNGANQIRLQRKDKTGAVKRTAFIDFDMNLQVGGTGGSGEIPLANLEDAAKATNKSGRFTTAQLTEREIVLKIEDGTQDANNLVLDSKVELRASGGPVTIGE